MHSCKIAFLALANKQKEKDIALCIFKHTSFDNQFYVCNYSGSLQDACGIVSICFVFSPKHLGLSSAQLVVLTKCGGFVMQQGKGLAVNHSIKDEIIDMEKIHFIGWWSKSISLFSSISLTVYAMLRLIMRTLFKKILR